MRIAIDLQGLQSEGSRIRGIGRYSFEIIKNIIEFGKDNEFILFSNGALKDLRHEFKEQLKRKNVLYPMNKDYFRIKKLNVDKIDLSIKPIKLLAKVDKIQYKTNYNIQ